MEDYFELIFQFLDLKSLSTLERINKSFYNHLSSNNYRAYLEIYFATKNSGYDNYQQGDSHLPNGFQQRHYPEFYNDQYLLENNLVHWKQFYFYKLIGVNVEANALGYFFSERFQHPSDELVRMRGILDSERNAISVRFTYPAIYSWKLINRIDLEGNSLDKPTVFVKSNEYYTKLKASSLLNRRREPVEVAGRFVKHQNWSAIVFEMSYCIRLQDVNTMAGRGGTQKPTTPAISLAQVENTLTTNGAFYDNFQKYAMKDVKVSGIVTSFQKIDNQRRCMTFHPRQTSLGNMLSSEFFQLRFETDNFYYLVFPATKLRELQKRVRRLDEFECTASTMCPGSRVYHLAPTEEFKVTKRTYSWITAYAIELMIILLHCLLIYLFRFIPNSGYIEVFSFLSFTCLLSNTVWYVIKRFIRPRTDPLFIWLAYLCGLAVMIRLSDSWWMSSLLGWFGWVVRTCCMVMIGIPLVYSCISAASDNVSIVDLLLCWLMFVTLSLLGPIITTILCFGLLYQI